jgi:hypothetical protein
MRAPSVAESTPNSPPTNLDKLNRPNDFNFAQLSDDATSIVILRTASSPQAAPAARGDLSPVFPIFLRLSCVSSV